MIFVWLFVNFFVEVKKKRNVLFSDDVFIDILVFVLGNCGEME